MRPELEGAPRETIQEVGTNSTIQPNSDTSRGRSNRVLVFRKLLLPVSETFILDQYASYRSWHPTLLGFHRVPGLDLGRSDAVVVANRLTWNQRLRLKLFQHGQYFGYVPKALRTLAAAQRPDIIHAHFAYDAILISGVAKRLRIPLVITLHGDDVLRRPEVWQSGAHGQFFRLYPSKLRRLFKDASVHFIAVSRAVAERAIEQGAPLKRMHVRYTGTQVSVPAATCVRDRSEILFVGRLVEVKGCEYLIRAMVQVQRVVPEAHLVIAGDGPLCSELETLAAQLGVRANFLGAVPRSVVRSRMAAARVLCLPSITDSEGAFEAFGMVILEAMSSGLAVVTSAKGGGEAISNGETGFSVAERDVTAMAAYIVELMRDDALFQRMTQNARAHVEAHFALDACTAEIERLYESILDGRS